MVAAAAACTPCGASGGVDVGGGATRSGGCGVYTVRRLAVSIPGETVRRLAVPMFRRSCCMIRRRRVHPSRPDWYTVRRLAVSIPGRGRATAGGSRARPCDGWRCRFRTRPCDGWRCRYQGEAVRRLAGSMSAELLHGAGCLARFWRGVYNVTPETRRARVGAFPCVWRDSVTIGR